MPVLSRRDMTRDNRSSIQGDLGLGRKIHLSPSSDGLANSKEAREVPELLVFKDTAVSNFLWIR